MNIEKGDLNIIKNQFINMCREEKGAIEIAEEINKIRRIGRVCGKIKCSQFTNKCKSNISIKKYRLLC